MRLVVALAIVGLLAGIVVSTAAALRFTDTPCPEGAGSVHFCAEGIVGASYSQQLNGASGCGPGLPYQYRILNGAPPPGISLSSSGLIGGTPTQTGTYSFWVELSDQDPPSQSWCVPDKAEREFSLTVLAGLSITTRSLPAGASVGVLYSAPLEAMLITSVSPPAGTVPAGLAWSVVSGTLPPGLALASGVISGTPTAEGTYQFVVRAELDSSRFDTETLTMVVRQPVTIAAPSVVPPSEVGAAFRMPLSASGGTGTFTWAVSDGALPTGVALAADGTISGTPAGAGSFRFTASATDAEGRIASYPGLLTVASRLAISTLKIRPAKVGRLYKAKLKALGGVLPKTWRVKSGRLPVGVKLDRTLGIFSGTPRKAGRYRVTVEVVDALKVKSTKTLLLLVAASPAG
jgi:hypothetical protein